MFAASKTAAVSSAANYIEDVFSTYLYTGNGSTQTITNGIDLSTKGGLAWLKQRNDSVGHRLYDTVRGATKFLESNGTAAESTSSTGLTAFTSSGFSLGNDPDSNTNNGTYVSWTFREQPKFFDIVTYTGNGTAGRTISHSLGSTPGCIMIKRTSGGSDWVVYHQSIGSSATLILNGTFAAANYGNNISNVTSTSFDVTGGTDSNANGSTYVAYVFAHNAGGFGLTGSDNVITCGSYTGNGSNTNGTNVDLGWEPQWILVKRATGGTSEWFMVDNMRGFTIDGTDQRLNANLSGAEDSTTAFILKSTGFQLKATGNPNTSGATYVYIAIRRGPMKVPTSGTSVFAPVAYTGNGGTQNLTTGFAGDMAWIDQRTDAGQRPQSFDKLRGNNVVIYQSSTSAEQTNSPTSYTVSFNNTQTVLVGPYSPNGIYNNSGSPQIAWNFQRAPSFFDEVCYTGTGSATTQAHNLGVVPEMIIVKGRTNTFSWFVYEKDVPSANQSFLTLNTDSAATSGSAVWNSTSPTSSVFSIGSANAINQSGNTYVAYLFATCAGVSKVGSYTGNGSSQTINCGFTGGARFVLIKRTDSTGDWYVYDTARGMTTLTDPYLLLNSTAAEVATLGSVTTVSTGFALNSSILAAINVSGGTYIFLAIA